MSGTRLVPLRDAKFPYDALKARLLAVPAMEIGDVQFGQMIEVGKRIGWSKEQLDAHESLRAGGRCFTFRQNQPPWLRGTFYDDNVFFEFEDQRQEEAMRPLILELARELPLRTVEY